MHEPTVTAVASAHAVPEEDAVEVALGPDAFDVHVAALWGSYWRNVQLDAELFQTPVGRHAVLCYVVPCYAMLCYATGHAGACLGAGGGPPSG